MSSDQSGTGANPYETPAQAVAEPSPSATGATHPCERVFGTCAGGAECPFRDAPREACVAFLKGRCRFGDRCREPHLLTHQGKYITALHPCLRIYGSCRYGDQCEYANLSSDTCVKFLKGRCTFGDRCKELHPGANTWATQQMGQMMPPMAMPQMAGMPMPMAPVPYGYGMPFPGTEEGGVLRGGKRGREGEAASTAWKRLTPDGQAFGMANYFQATAGGTVHPCVRIYGSCRDGAYCKFAMLPIGACLQYLKGTCKFGDACREQHVQVPGQENRNKGPGGKHPCERVYGFCKDGERCRFADFPAESCVMFLKGKCKFGDACRELHTRGPAPAEDSAEKR